MKKVSFILFFLLVILIGCHTTPIHTVSFNSMGGSEVADVTVKSGNPLPLPNVEREGYSLEGWYTSLDNGLTLDEKWIFIEFGVYEDLTLYAKWTINQYTISFDTAGGTEIAPITQDYNSLININNPSKIGHTFVKWIPELPNRMPAENITLHAQWRINQHSITYAIVTEDFDPLSYIILNLGETIIQSFLGNHHSSALTSTGRLFMWGYNADGQLGDNTITDRLVPTEITSHFNLTEEETIIQVSLGGFHSSALTSTDRLFMWGVNWFGQLGDNTTIDRLAPTEITSHFNLSEDETIIQVSLSLLHSSALTSTGRLFTWGRNYTGQLGDNTTTDRLVPTEITSHFNLIADETIIQVSLGSNHSSALTSTDRLFMWGWNFYGQLGDNTTTDRLAPTEITSHFNLTEDETIIQVSLGSALDKNHSSALTSSGRIFMWGNNEFGQLGDNTTIDRSVPTALNLQAFKTYETAIYDYNQDIIGLTPNMDGYIFDGWFSDIKLTTPYIFTTMPANDIVLYGRWIQD